MSTNKSDHLNKNVIHDCSSEVVLRGYLNKLSHKGLKKSWKRKWFVYDDSNCTLKYFISPDNEDSVEIIDINNATFSIDECKDHKNSFKIRTRDNEYTLAAQSHEMCYQWLKFLQNSRRNHSLRRTDNLHTTVLGNTQTSFPESGLLGNETKTADDSTRKQFHESVSSSELSPDKMKSSKQSYHNVKKQIMNVLMPRSTSNVNENSDDQGSGDICDDVEDEEKNKASLPPRLPRKLSFRNKFRRSKDSLDEKSEMKLMEKVDKLKIEKSSLEEELNASQEVIHILQQHLSSISPSDNESVNVNKLNQMEKNDNTADLELKLENTKLLVQTLQQEKEHMQTNIDNLEEQTIMLKDLLTAKDDAIISLTNNIFELELQIKENSVPNHSETNRKESLGSLDDYENLKDSVEAYRVQNQFLNSEIIELNKLINDANSREEKLLSMCSNWEAKVCQVQSKYFVLLKELHSPQSDPKKSSSLVSQLVKDVLEQDAKHQKSKKANVFPAGPSQYDELGFNVTWGMEDDVLGQRAQEYVQRSKVLHERQQSVDNVQLTQKWENMMQNINNKDISKNLDLKFMIRSGIPHKHRGIIWKKCVDMKVKNIKARLKPNYYHNLLATHTKVNKQDPFVKQIELDLLRTLPNNKHYESMHSDGILRLRRILLAYSWHNPSVGYCQGINRLVAIALLYLEEEDSFWCLVAIIEKIMPVDYYSKTLITSQVDQRVLKDLMQEKLPRLNSHLEENNVDLSLVTFTWLLTVFIDNIPVKTYLNIWDSFLYEGSKVLFRYALAIFKFLEDELLSLNDYMSINSYLRSISRTLDNISALNNIAFNGLQSLSMRSIASKRTYHMQIVKRELESLAAIRAADYSEEKEDSCSDND